MLSKTLQDGLNDYAIGAKIRALRLTKKITLPTLLPIALVFGIGLEFFFVGARKSRSWRSRGRTTGWSCPSVLARATCLIGSRRSILRQPDWEAILVFHLPPSERADLAPRYLPVLVQTGASEDAWLSVWSKKASLQLLSSLPERWAVQCIESVRRVRSDAGRARVLEPLLPTIPESQRRAILVEELERARMSDATDQLVALSEFVRHSPEAKRGELAEIVRIESKQLPNGSERNGVIARIAPWLPENVAGECVRGAFSQLKEIKHDHLRSDAPAALVPCLPGDLYPAAIAQAIDLLPNSDFAASNALFGYMSVEQRDRTFDGMMERVAFLMGEMSWSLARLVGAVVGSLSDAHLDRLLRLSLSVSEEDRADILAIVAAAQRLSAEEAQETLTAVRTFKSAVATRQPGGDDLGTALERVSAGKRMRRARQYSRYIS